MLTSFEFEGDVQFLKSRSPYVQYAQHPPPPAVLVTILLDLDRYHSDCTPDCLLVNTRPEHNSLVRPGFCYIHRGFTTDVKTAALLLSIILDEACVPYNSGGIHTIHMRILRIVHELQTLACLR